MAEKKKNTIVVLEPSAKSAKELLALIQEKDLADVLTVNSPEEAIQAIVSSLPCMFMASINDNQDVPGRIQLFKRLENLIKHQGLKVYVVTPIKNRQLADMVTQKFGVTDFIVEPVPVRTMQFKANLQLKALDNFRRQLELKKASEEQIVIKKLDTKKADAVAGAEVKTNGKPALQAGEDTFLFKNSGVKKAGKKFTVELEGPDPSTGEWVPHEDKGDAQTAWRWVPNEEKEKQAKGEAPPDGWVHKGDKPQFNDNSQKWAMSSETPSLALQAKGKTLAQKMGLDESGEVFVAEDSPAAEENLKKNRAKAALIKPKKEKRSAKDLLGDDGEESDGPPSGAKLKENGEVKPDAKKSARDGSKAKDGEKNAALKSLLAGEDDEDEVSAGILNDKRDPKNKDTAMAVKDKRGGKDPAEEAIFNDLKDAQPDDASKPASPLAFLQRKKDKQKQGSLASLKADSEDNGENALKESDEEREAPDRALKQKKGGKSAKDLLSRLGKSLAETPDAAPDEDEAGFENDSEESGEEPGSSRAGKPAMKLGKGRGRNGKSALDALREDPADDPGEFHDLREEGAAERLAALREEKTQTLTEIQALLQSPLPDKLTSEEEEEIREELGLKGRPEIQPKELVRRKRLKNAQELKSRLADLDSALSEAEEEKGEAFSSSERKSLDKADGVTGDLSRDKLKGIRGAFDSAEDEESSEEEVRKRSQAREEERKRKAANKDKAEYMPEADLLPLGNAWESATSHYVYLDATVRYKGFGKLEELLPLWIFEGEDVPQLLDKTKQWRFLGGLPFQARSVSDIPVPVRDYLIGLRDQLLRAKNAVEADEDTSADELAETDEAKPGSSEKDRKRESKDGGKVRGLGKSIDELFAEEPEVDSGEAATSDSAFDDLSAEADAPKQKTSARFSEEAENASVEESAEEIDDGAKARPAEFGRAKSKAEKKAIAKKRAEESDREAIEEKRGRNKKAHSDRIEEEAKASFQQADDEAEVSGENKSNENSTDKEAADPMARLRAKLGMDSDSSESDASGETKDSLEAPSEKERTLDELAASLNGNENEESQQQKLNDGEKDSVSAESSGIKTGSKSEGVQKFMERRKKKLEEAAAVAEATASSNPSLSAKKGGSIRPPSGYLGVYVALSDGYANSGESAAALTRILAALESSFKNCVVYCTAVPDADGKADVSYRSPLSPAPVEKIPLTGGLSEPIQRRHGSDEEVLGYLFMGAIGERTTFDDAEELTFRSMAARIWPLLLQAGKKTETRAA